MSPSSASEVQEINRYSKIAVELIEKEVDEKYKEKSLWKLW
ncbi:hypothetical protein [Clostridium sp. FP1]|nr:hypothetical protein [Clostridium sp. FP1]